MNKSRVVILRANGYDDALSEKMETGLKLLGGIESIVPTNGKVLVKPNLLSNALPERAATTHPKMFGAFLKLLRDHGYEEVSYGDSPGSPVVDLLKTVTVTGLKKEAEKYNVPLADFENSVTVSFPEGKKCRKFVLCKAVTETDSLISLCKMKTHALENITGAVKNQYGCIFAANKALGHTKYPDSRSFAEMLIDLNKCVKPKLYVMDGILAMEGNGPASGDPVPMNILLFSTDPVALDTVFSRLIYLNPKFVPTTVAGAKMGLGTMNEEEIEITDETGVLTFSEAIRKYGKENFRVRRENPHFWSLGILLRTRRKPKDRPVVDPEKCIACGICEKACPVEGKAVHSGNGLKATYDYKKCIRCYCCQEMCPVKAISREDKRK